MSEEKKSTNENDSALREGINAQPAALSEGDAARQPLPFGMSIVMTLLVSIGITVIGILAYHKFFSNPPLRIGTVDINEVMQIKQLQLTAMATRPGATDQDREAAYDEISRFGRNMESAIAEMQQYCNCVIMVRAAVIRGQHEDMTADLLKRLGMENASLEKSVKSLVSAGKSENQPLDLKGVADAQRH